MRLLLIKKRLRIFSKLRLKLHINTNQSENYTYNVVKLQRNVRFHICFRKLKVLNNEIYKGIFNL